MEMYRDHVAMIDLNPLVVERFACRPPSYAPTDEYWSTWYTIKDKVSYLPGGLAQGSVSYHACFNDSKDGLETHVYAPLGLEIRGKWSVGGRLPGEPKPPAEPGLKTPRHGLYIREDVKMTCSSLLLAFVRKTFKDSHSRLVEKLVEKAHVLESNFANERLQALRNVDPGERMGHGDIFIAPPPDYECSGGASHTTSPRYVSHSRYHSDPILSPGFSSSSTLYDQNETMLSPAKDDVRPVSFRFILEEKPVSSSAPESNSFLLPATSYTNDIAKQPRPTSLCPNLQTERIISLLPLSPRPSQEDLRLPQDEHHSLDSEQHHTLKTAPHLSYDPQDRPISFTFSFDHRSPFDKRSTSESAHSSQQHLLDDIDDAIDEVFKYTSPLPATTAEIVQAKKCDILPATKFEAADVAVLPKATYAPKRERKDSVVPPHEYADKALPALPPVPLKDEKWRKKLGI
ncbi:hypothetical protein T440DRAFT_415466 [Plenodomus tracheiphilus IPT5]|uniref:DUF7053 domain-containing protein n=1 Tax=Plenodomus tracheiphilus IPT5 TaxID=1408161 RepID=A0A6A7BIX0_9PLEO|nr:hypothetical protein T440DRAFT_415466 [Plenodomus tracheiphilus IPT5]